jgi:hypothetical protein
LSDVKLSPSSVATPNERGKVKHETDGAQPTDPAVVGVVPPGHFSSDAWSCHVRVCYGTRHVTGSPPA